MIQELRKKTVSAEKAKTLSTKELEGKFVVGELRSDLDRTWSGYAQ
jgi:hypothetical protein